MKDIIFKTNGEIIKTSPKNGTYYTLEELKEIVGGYIEIVRLKENRFMIVNEDGKLNNLPYNKKATGLFRLRNNTDDFIVGDTLVCHTNRII